MHVWTSSNPLAMVISRHAVPEWTLRRTLRRMRPILRCTSTAQGSCSHEAKVDSFVLGLSCYELGLLKPSEVAAFDACLKLQRSASGSSCKSLDAGIEDGKIKVERATMAWGPTD